ncbi:AlbA family DNA-binding domain-containing protein [Lysobacter fragariae]
MESSYSPFSKQLEDVLVDDLVALRTVHEGWYVEYKEAVPNPPAIAKSVSAFANTYGGFLFYGVKEKSKDNNVADEFLGIASCDVESMRERIRQAICAHSAPEPHFDIKVWSGPSDALELAEGRSIICIRVPRSSRAPHIHKSGVIYRRVADSSEPTPENDRHALGELFKRSDKLLEKYRSWYGADPDFHYEAEKTHPYLRILIAFDPWRERRPWLQLTTPEIRKLFNPDDKPA